MQMIVRQRNENDLNCLSLNIQAQTESLICSTSTISFGAGCAVIMSDTMLLLLWNAPGGLPLSFLPFFALNLLFSYQVNENAPSGTFIGTLSLFDEDRFDTHLYRMVTNSNGLFMLKGNQLLKAKSADYETSKKHTISVMATDNGTNPQPYSVSRTGNRIVVRGHLKSSHIADKRKNFHMALYPLPPSSNESVIDNGRSVWQMALHIILVLPHSLPKQCRLSHVRRDASLKVQRPLWNEQGDMLEPRRKTRLFAFCARSKAGDQCRSPVSNWSKFLSAPSTWPSKANRYLRWIVCSCMHAPPAFFAWTCSRSCNYLRHFIRDFLLTASAAARLVDSRAFFLSFFFFLLSIAQRIGSWPPPSHMKVLSFVRDVRTFEMTPKLGSGWLLSDQAFKWACLNA